MKLASGSPVYSSVSIAIGWAFFSVGWQGGVTQG